MQSQQPTAANERYKIRIAAIEREKQKQNELKRKIMEREVLDLLGMGERHEGVSKIIGFHVSEVARIEKSNEDRQRFLRTL